MVPHCTAPPRCLLTPWIPRQDPADPTLIRMFDPTSGGVLGNGTAKVFTDADVQATVASARVAQAEWVKTSFAERGEVLKLINDYIVCNQDLICRVASRDTGKTSAFPRTSPMPRLVPRSVGCDLG